METVGSERYDRVAYPEGAFFVFGRETTGLPKELVEKYNDHLIRLPMRQGLRSLNLSNAVAVTVYEAFRQHDFQGLKWVNGCIEAPALLNQDERKDKKVKKKTKEKRCKNINKKENKRMN